MLERLSQAHPKGPAYRGPFRISPEAASQPSGDVRVRARGRALRGISGIWKD